MKPFPTAPLMFFTGKGGTGKTTVATAVALALTGQGRQVALVELDRSHIPGLLRCKRATYAGTPTRHGITIFNLTPREAFAEYAIKRLGSATLYRTIFDNRFVHYFLDATPGLNELVCLGKLWTMLAQREFDHILIDLHATGHGLSFLDVPRILTQALHRGPLYDFGHDIQAMLRDAARTQVYAVTLAEELPAAEALQIRTTLHERLQIHCGGVIANRLDPDPLPGELARAFAQWATTAPADHPYRRATQYLATQQANQATVLQELTAHFGEALWTLPAVATPDSQTLLSGIGTPMETWRIA